MNDSDKGYYSNIPKSKLIFYFIVIVTGIILFMYLFVFGLNSRKLYKRLEVKGILDTALVVRDFIGAKGKLNFEYKFEAKGDTNNGFHQYTASDGQIAIGDSVLIKYLPEDADDINRIVRNNDKSLIKIE